MTNQKGNTNIILLAVIVALVGALVYLVGVPRGEENGETGTKTEDSSSDWQVYSNSSSGYELRYPSDWEVVDGRILPRVYADRCGTGLVADDNCSYLEILGSLDGTFSHTGSGSGIRRTYTISELPRERIGSNDYFVLHDEFEAVGENFYYIAVSDKNYLGFADTQRYDQLLTFTQLLSSKKNRCFETASQELRGFFALPKRAVDLAAQRSWIFGTVIAHVFALDR